MQSIADLSFVAGHAALDFVNTAEGRGGPGAGEALNTPAALAAWGQRYGILTDARADTDAAAELGRALSARELLYEVFLSRVTGQPVPGESLSRLAGLAAEAYAAGRLRPAGDGNVRWTWPHGELVTVRHVAVTSALDLLRDVPDDRLKQCPGDNCGWLFLDTTKRGNRRWCSMSECGQDAKDERRRARRRASAGAAASPSGEPRD
ncbi:MAG TPA: ABATE domain-containing protein [Trebonia sp.]